MDTRKTIFSSSSYSQRLVTPLFWISIIQRHLLMIDNLPPEKYQHRNCEEELGVRIMNISGIFLVGIFLLGISSALCFQAAGCGGGGRAAARAGPTHPPGRSLWAGGPEMDQHSGPLYHNFFRIHGIVSEQNVYSVSYWMWSGLRCSYFSNQRGTMSMIFSDD